MKSLTIIFSLRTITIVFLTLYSLNAIIAQEVVNSNSQKAKDTIQVKQVKTDKNGKLVPRVALTGTLDYTTLKGTTTNLLIFNTATAGTGKIKVYPGYYHNVGTTEQPEWKRVEVTVSNAVQKK